MSALMTRGMAALNRLMAVAAPVTSCTYTRIAGGSAVTLTDFIPGKSAQMSQNGPGEPATRLEFTERDILGPVASLTQSGTAFTPAVGDRWTETINGTAYTFEVSKMNGLPAWAWCDQQRTRIRIRGKRV